MQAAVGATRRRTLIAGDNEKDGAVRVSIGSHKSPHHKRLVIYDLLRRIPTASQTSRKALGASRSRGGLIGWKGRRGGGRGLGLDAPLWGGGGHSAGRRMKGGEQDVGAEQSGLIQGPIPWPPGPPPMEGGSQVLPKPNAWRTVSLKRRCFRGPPPPPFPSLDR